MDEEAKQARLKVLKKLAQVESSGGKFREHDVVKEGVNAGHRAVSSYGLMPISVYELAQKYRPFAESQVAEQIRATGGDPEQINKLTENPAIDDEAALALWEWNQKRLGKYVKPEDLEKAGVKAHRRGVSGTIKSYLAGEPLDQDPYVQKYYEVPDEE